jgi:transposase
MTTEAYAELACEAVDDKSGMYDGHIDSMSAIERLPEVEVSVGSLVIGPYLRQAGTSAAHVHMLADVADSAKLPPILVQKNGARVVDGMHRLEAAKLRQREHISARIIECSDEEALLLAIKSNTLHGLPLSRPDRLSGARRILAAHPDWSDRAVAEIAGLSAKTIGAIRKRSADAILPLEKRLGRDGKRRPVAGREGRRRAADYIYAHPDASLRQIARESDVSLGTVQDVRERIRNGMDPESGRYEPLSEQIAERSIRAVTQDRSSASSANMRSMKHTTQQVSWSAMSAKLTNDPALRYTEGGRAFLRWMAVHAVNAEEWNQFIDVIPVHWLREVGQVADSIGMEWVRFAERVRTREQSAS